MHSCKPERTDASRASTPSAYRWARKKVEQILFEIRARATDGVNLVRANHRRETAAKLGGAHRARERHEHLPAFGDVRVVGLGGIVQQAECLVLDRKAFHDEQRVLSHGVKP